MAEIPYALKGEREVRAVQSSPGELELRHAWLHGRPRWTYPALLVLAAAGLVFFFGWPASQDHALFELGLLAVLAYPLAALCYNTTTLTVTPHELRWRYGPLPWKPAGRIAREEIAAFTYGRIFRTISAEEAAEQRRSGYRPAPRYGVTMRLRKRGRERRILDLIGSEATAAAACGLLAEVLGGVPVEPCRQRDRGQLPEWGYGLILLGVLVFVGLLIASAMSGEP